MRANTIGGVVALLLFIAAAGGVFGYYLDQSHKTPPVTKTPQIESLTPQEITQLGSIGDNLGTTNQVLNIGADTLFRGNANVVGNLSVGGHLNANGPVTLSQLLITGSTAATGLSVGSNLDVTGTTTLQKSLTVNALTTVNSGLTVSGQLSAAGITAGSLSVNTISISGPLTIGHLRTNGPTPFFAPGAVGGGGTVNLGGNDTAGTININCSSAGCSANADLISVTYRAAFTAITHVLLTPKTAAAAAAEPFVTSSNAGFQVWTVNGSGHADLAYDYFVTQ